MDLNGSMLLGKNTIRRGKVNRVLIWGSGVVLLATLVTSMRAGDTKGNDLSLFDWPVFGQNVSNTANNFLTTIGWWNASGLKVKWTFTTGGDVSARAAVVNGVAYFPDWAGNIFAVNTSNGKALWSHQLSDYGLAAGTVSRTSPAVANNVVYVGTQYNPSGPTGYMLAINAL